MADDQGARAVDEAAPGRIGYYFNVHVHGVPEFGCASKIEIDVNYII
jgi:hypothetical protein